MVNEENSFVNIAEIGGRQKAYETMQEELGIQRFLGPQTMFHAVWSPNISRLHGLSEFPRLLPNMWLSDLNPAQTFD